MKLQGIISGGLNLLNQPVIEFFVIRQVLEKNLNTMSSTSAVH
jgi:hypothetical protein